jgi:putative heme-binding domain-containing protein
MNSDLRSRLIALAEAEPDSSVRSQLASSCQRWGSLDALPILSRLSRRDHDATDTHIPNLIWWAFERQLRNDRPAVVALLCSPEAQHGVLYRAILERTARLLASDGTDADFALCARLLAAAPPDEKAGPIVTGMDLGLEGRRLDPAPPALVAPLQKRWAACRGAPGIALIRLCARMGRPEAIGAAIKLARDPHAHENERSAMIELLGQLGRGQDAIVLLGLIDPGSSTSIQLAAVSALGRFQDPALSASLLSHARSAAPPVRDRVVNLLASRPAWARALVDAVGRGEVAPRELTPATVQLIATVADPPLLHRLESLWGKLPSPGSPEKKRRIAEVRGLLPEGDKGSAARGKLVFKESCATCHKLFDEGESIGPELTGADRGNLDFLLTSLVDPSAQVRKEFQSQTIALKDGRVLSGLVVDENDRVLTLIDSNRQKTPIARDLIEQSKPADTSLMPEGMLEKLTEPQIRDLFRYLQSSGVK